MGIPPSLRDELIRYLLATSQQRAHSIGELATRNPEMMALLIDLETDDVLEGSARDRATRPGQGSQLTQAWLRGNIGL